MVVLKEFLDIKGISHLQITGFCCDMSLALISGIEKNFPDGSITFDIFHVMKIVNKALSRVRRQEQATT